MALDHFDRFNRTFQGAEATADAGLFIFQARVVVRIVGQCTSRKSDTSRRTCFDAVYTSHAGFEIEAWFLPF